jgi:hypothetical protein
MPRSDPDCPFVRTHPSGFAYLRTGVLRHHPRLSRSRISQRKFVPLRRDPAISYVAGRRSRSFSAAKWMYIGYAVAYKDRWNGRRKEASSARGGQFDWMHERLTCAPVQSKLAVSNLHNSFTSARMWSS